MSCIFIVLTNANYLYIFAIAQNFYQQIYRIERTIYNFQLKKRSYDISRDSHCHLFDTKSPINSIPLEHKQFLRFSFRLFTPTSRYIIKWNKFVETTLLQYAASASVVLFIVHDLYLDMETLLCDLLSKRSIHWNNCIKRHKALLWKEQHKTRQFNIKSIINSIYFTCNIMWWKCWCFRFWWKFRGGFTGWETRWCIWAKA